MLAGMKSEWVAGFVSESMAGFIGIRTRINPSEPDIAPEDATEVPDKRDVEAQRPAASRGR